MIGAFVAMLIDADRSLYIVSGFAIYLLLFNAVDQQFAACGLVHVLETLNSSTVCL